ncbi:MULTISPECIES: restriction endonuclease subunit S [Bacillus cereus group]|nr:restriction endonuclease subunit S [Bacillus cereus]
MDIPKVKFTKNPNFTVYRIGELLEFYSRKCELISDKEYQLVTVKRRNEGIVDRGKFKGKEIKTPTQFYIKTGDFLISKRQIVHGACEIVPYQFDNAIVSNEYTVVKGKKGLLITEYFNLLSKTNFMKKYYFLSSYGVDIEKMVFNVEDWKKRTIYIPSIEEQRRVVDLFNAINKKIKLQQERITLLKELKKDYMQRIFKQEIRFKDENGGEYPKWKINTMNDLAKITMGFTPDTKNKELWEGKIPWLSIAGLEEKYITDGNKFISENAVVNKEIVPKDTLIMSFKLTLGKLAIVKSPLYTNEAICHFHWTNSLINTEYMYYYLSNINISTFGSRAAKGITLNKESLNAIAVKLPVLKEQKKIATFLSKLDEKVQKEQQKLEALQEQKKGFMQQMFI